MVLTLHWLRASPLACRGCKRSKSVSVEESVQRIRDLRESRKQQRRDVGSNRSRKSLTKASQKPNVRKYLRKLPVTAIYVVVKLQKRIGMLIAVSTHLLELRCSLVMTNRLLLVLLSSLQHGDHFSAVVGLVALILHFLHTGAMSAH